MLAEFSSLQHCRQSRNVEADVRSDFQEKLFRNNFPLIRFSCCGLFQQLSIIWFGKIVGNCSGCWELSSFSFGERLSSKLDVANRKIVGNSKPKSWYGSTFALSWIKNFVFWKVPSHLRPHAQAGEFLGFVKIGINDTFEVWKIETYLQNDWRRTLSVRLPRLSKKHSIRKCKHGFCRSAIQH